MRNPFRQTYLDDKLDLEITSLMHKMSTTDPLDDEYPILLANLERLNKMKLEHKPKRVTRDALVTGGFHILGIAILIFAERNAIFPKLASSQIGRPKS